MFKHQMARRMILTCTLGMLAALRCTWTLAYEPPAASGQVAELKLEWQDAKRDRAVPVKIYYPSQDGKPLPVVIFSHGLGGSREGYEYLGRHWAGAGYVSVHLQHLGSDDSVWKDQPVKERGKMLQQSGASLINAVNRPLDVKFALDQLDKLNAESSSPLAGRLDVARSAIAGHSFGGYTAMAMAGQSASLLKGKAPSFTDPRIRCAIQMSAPIPPTRGNLDAVYGSITMPVMHMTGTRDFVELFPQTKPEDRRLPYDHMKQAETCLVIFKDGDHMIFSGRGRVGPGAKLARDAAFQKLICAGATAYLDAYLKDDAEAKQWLLDGGYKKMLADQASFESKKPAARLGGK